MAVFSVNQATHLYKLSGTNVKTSGNHIYFEAVGANGTLRTDLIDKKNVLSITKTTTTDLNIKVTPIEITLADKVITTGEEDTAYVLPGEYVVRIIVNNYYGPSVHNGLIKHAAVFVGANTDKATFFSDLKKSIDKNLSRELEAPFTTAATEDGITITPVASEWKLGTKSMVVPTIEVVGVWKDFGNGFEEEWLVDTPATAVAVEKSGSKKLCDLEYFALGERGDQYRNVGWPNVIETKGVLNPSTEYDIVTIHYAYVGSNESVQKSEKDMVLVVTQGQGATLESAIKTALE